MITFQMLSAAIYTLVGMAALVVALTQWCKNMVNKDNKRWLNHLLSFIVSAVVCSVVLWIGVTYGVGLYTEFCVTCFDDWAFYVGTIIGCTGIANGLWSYEFMQKILEWIRLLPKQEEK